jgi:methionyl-tRNA formyltransferase
VSRAGGDDSVSTVFFGSGGFAVPILEALLEVPGVHVAAVVSAPDRPVGRKAILTPTPVAARASELGLPVLKPVRIRRPDAVAELSALAPELIVLADYGQLIPRVLLDLPPRGFLNLHPSLLPRWRGAAPIPATLLAGDVESAVTLMLVTEEMDAGPIVAVEPLDVRPEDTAVTLEERAAAVAGELLRRALPDWLAGGIEPRPQSVDGVTLTRPLRRQDGRLDPTRPAVELERQIRAYQPWPGGYMETPLGRLIVWSAGVGESGVGEAPGLIVATDGGGLALATADRRLVLGEVQLAGKTRCAASELRRGYPALVGMAAGEG